MKIRVLDQKIYINYPIRCKQLNKKGGETEYFKFSATLGKQKGFIRCKCFNMRHDLTKLRFIDDVYADLISYKIGEKVLYELKIITYKEPKITDFIVKSSIPIQGRAVNPLEVNIKPAPQPKQEPLKQEIVEVNEELPPMEDTPEDEIWELMK